MNILPTQLLRSLLSAVDEVKIDQLAINNFQHQDEVIGRYDIRTIPAELAETLLDTYKRDITRATISITSPDFGYFIVQLQSKGSLRVRCEESLLGSIHAFIKSIYFMEDL